MFPGLRFASSRLLVIMFLYLTPAYALALTLSTLNPQTLPIKGGQLEYYRFGQGSPIVLIEGYVSDVTSWNREFLADLAAEHEVIVFNNSQVGLSQVTHSNYDAEALAEDCYQLIEGLNLYRPAVLGISMGGMIAQALAIQHPDKIGSLILMNTLIAGHEARLPQASTERILEEMPQSKVARFWVALKLYFSSSWRFRMGYALVFDRFIPQQYTEVDPLKVRAEQSGLILKWLDDNASARKIKELHLPVLILSGGADHVIPPQNSYILATAIPHALLGTWREGGHGMIYQFPQELATQINEFIRDNQKRAALDLSAPLSA